MFSPALARRRYSWSFSSLRSMSAMSASSPAATASMASPATAAAWRADERSRRLASQAPCSGLAWRRSDGAPPPDMSRSSAPSPAAPDEDACDVGVRMGGCMECTAGGGGGGGAADADAEVDFLDPGTPALAALVAGPEAAEAADALAVPLGAPPRAPRGTEPLADFFLAAGATAWAAGAEGAADDAAEGGRALCGRRAGMPALGRP
jgi:hypothetical protein